MISRDAQPIGHVSPYKRIDPAHPGRKRIITYAEWRDSGDTREPDPALYAFHYLAMVWILKEGI